MIEVEQLTKRYGATTVLSGASFQARPGQTTILTGDNGTGKTTLLRILAGLARPSSGTARIAGCDLTQDRRQAQARLSFLPQNLAFHPAMTPERLLGFYARLRQTRTSREQISRLLERFDLLDDRHKPVRQLSGGMLQRLGLALLLLPEATVLLLDEPAISLDPGWRQRLAALLHEQTAQGRTVFLTTHLPEEWKGEAHVHLSCRDGKIVPETDTAAVDPATSQASPGNDRSHPSS